ncbi:MAG: hypothetical protein A3E36_00925 [Candidatus Andersenbacteria bacterium RIFCSPHIGHO2_12_FULL_45_11b]|uniref:Prepilin peptidase n=1 Tax=Candidatus Andersenbacteria bacterium RIFCSPHIGHO2_12_FULL_45_11b TaxID=1797282 RepID=A0A1G1X8A0_9BACT|nr:MAG: hypothetical protein A3E36_00925 [Candidatus Andersenbacteria bacterium RIFCSPHIGHO2_12_FULL_45_11b]
MLTLFAGFLVVVLFLLGSAIGSFLLVVADRYETGENPLRGRSRCDFCKKKLGWAELIPYISFLHSRGRCNTCKQVLSAEYPIFELASGLLCIGIMTQAILAWQHVFIATLMYIAACVLLILIRIDMRAMILPDKFIILLGIIAIMLALLARHSFDDMALGLLAGVGFLYALWAMTGGRGIGFGDVKLMIPFGILFGFHGVVTLLFTAFFIGGLVGLYLIGIKKAQAKTAIPFGPFLAIAAFFLMMIPDLPNRFFQLLGVQ